MLSFVLVYTKRAYRLKLVLTSYTEIVRLVRLVILRRMRTGARRISLHQILIFNLLIKDPTSSVAVNYPKVWESIPALEFNIKPADNMVTTLAVNLHLRLDLAAAVDSFRRDVCAVHIHLVIIVTRMLI